MISNMRKAPWKALAIVLLALLALSLLMLWFSGNLKKENFENDIFNAVGQEPSASSKKISIDLQQLLQKKGFMPVYRKVYRTLFTKNETDFEKKLACATALLNISFRKEILLTHKRSSIRLFMYFCRSNLVDIKAAINLTKILRSEKVLSQSKEIETQWQNYLKLVFNKRLKPELKKNKKLDGLNLKFVELSPNLKVKALELITPPKKHIVESYEYVLKENATGTAESDYKLKKTETVKYW